MEYNRLDIQDEMDKFKHQQLKQMDSQSIKTLKMWGIAGTNGSTVTTTSGSGGGGEIFGPAVVKASYGKGISMSGVDFSYDVKPKIIGVKWFGEVGFVAVLSGAPNSGEWKVYCGNVDFSSSPEDDAQKIASHGSKIPDWTVATALFPDLDPQLFIW